MSATHHHIVAEGPAQRRAGLSVFAGVIAASAWGGAAGLIIGFLTLGPVVESRLPLHSPVLGALALAAIVAVPMTILAMMAWQGDPRTGEAAVVCGVLQVGWIVVEVLFIWELSFFHPLYLLVGAALIVVGLRTRPSPRT